MKLDIQLFASGTINGSSTASNCDCRITWSSTGDTSTNSSSVTANVQIRRSGSSSTTGTFSGSLTINGTKYSISKKFSPYNWGSWATVGSKTVTIEHDSDGTKTIPIKCSLSNTGTSMAGTYTASGNATLDTLHKAPTINSITMQEVNPALIQASIDNNYFVLGLSQKQFTINATYEDDATYDHTTVVNQYGVIFQNSWQTLISTKNIELSSNNILDTKTNNLEILIDNTQTPITRKVALNYIVYDSMGGSSKYSENYTNYDYKTYSPITLNASVKRVGQTSGNVKITANGTYYNGTIGNENHSGTYKPTIIYKYWEAGQSESQATIVAISESNITTSNGTYSCEIQISGFDYEKAYRFKVAVQDTLNTDNSMYFSSASTSELNIATGKAVWTEYKDRVDFAKLTINHQEILAPYVLYYDDTEKGTAGAITLSADSKKYKQIELFYNWEEDYGYSSIKIDNPDNKLVSIMASYDNGTYYYLETARYLISGTSLSRSNSARWRFRTDGNATRTNTTSSGGSIRIYKVVGYE